MSIPFLTRWLQIRKNKKFVEVFVKLEMRKAKIIAYKRKYGLIDPK